MKQTALLFAGLLLLAVLVATPAMAAEFARIDKLTEGDLEVVGFELPKAAQVDIDGVGVRMRTNDKLVVYAWILNSDTREPVWVMKGSKTKRLRDSHFLRQVDQNIMLDKGRYELYMFAGNIWGTNFTIGGGKDVIEFLSDLFDDGDYEDEDMRDYIDECFMSLSSNELSRDDVSFFDPTGVLPKALIAHTKMGDDEFIEQAFTLDKAMNLRIYSVIEHPRGYKTAVDFGWIINMDTREKVWVMDRWNTERAGGGRKNRVYDDEVRLEAGNYVLYFATDDSHSWDRFNVAPPYDPLNWGITVAPGADFDPNGFHLTEGREDMKPIIDFSRARNNDYHEQAFELKKPMKLRVYALGERTSGTEFADYGMITNASNGDVVWEMTKSNTEPAGGADKNWMFDGFVDLAAGKYVATYTTDGSHAYRSWNASEPFDPRAWGMQIYPGEDFDADSFAKVDMDDLVPGGGTTLASLVRMRDDMERRERFTLDKRTKVNIYAIGEGKNGQMYDYGWIEDARTGRSVWEMTYRKTDHAGGSQKNRKYSGSIVLEPGEYELWYVTDGSHSFNDWNETRPRDARNWGITVSVAEEDLAGR
ncbi:MAG: hypothetical protein KKA42_00585 [candidate division Zixibacteria bacterium]|nr:hypothetical protein [candidate division Zixibacteria bacterium]